MSVIHSGASDELWMADEQVVDAMEELFEGERIFDSVYDLIRQLGCRLVYQKTIMNDNGKITIREIGCSPEPSAARLCEGGIVAVGKRDLWSLGWAAHEAMHHFMGFEIDDDETEMMVLEWVFYNSVKQRSHRRELLGNLAGSYIAGITILGHIQQYKGSQFFHGVEWGSMVEQAVGQGVVDWDMNVGEKWLGKLKN